MARTPGVAAALVVAHEDGAGDRRLVAYVVPAIGTAIVPAPSAATLRDALRARLPEYMVPSSFVLLDALPLTPSGKIDRNKLPAPSFERDRLARQYAAPSTPHEH
ncbi:MAG TPA: hypothetical protein VK932_06840, partial [Kofleriaceae bacterium]|nr:hypothetical protein [Kofleriaceae bacterium]